MGAVSLCVIKAAQGRVGRDGLPNMSFLRRRGDSIPGSDENVSAFFLREQAPFSHLQETHI